MAGAFVQTARAANVPVNIIDYAFSPMAVTINVDDTVVLTWTVITE